MRRPTVLILSLQLVFLVCIGREVLLKKKLSTVDLLVLPILDLLLYILKLLITFFTKQATLVRRSNVLNLPLHLVFPVCIGREVLLKGKAQYG